MKFPIRKKIFFGLFLASIIISACVSPEQEDPFERLPEEPVETLAGEIFPFSVSISTRATHRLENDGKLVAYLASKIVRLEDFEGRKVEVDGVWRTEKMREIFWVEAIRLTDLNDEEEKLEMDKRFQTKRFTFTFPKNWEYSASPDGTAHFIDKNDENRRVFLTFTVGEPTLVEKNMESNVLIANLEGVKKVKIDENGTERQDIMLRSNLYPNTKYHFIFSAGPEDFERKKAFSRLLNEFIEGEEKVLKAIEKDQKQMANFEAEKARRQKEKEEAKKLMEETEKRIAEAEKLARQGDSSLLEKLLSSKDVKEKEVPPTPEDNAKTEEIIEAESMSPKTKIPFPDEYEDLIDERAFLYDSPYLGLAFKVPANYWFRHFGAGKNSLADIAFADHEVNSRADAKFMLKILSSNNPPEGLTESIDEKNILIITMPRNSTSYFEMMGPVEYRDAMRSVLGSIENY